jgi:excisionase family DNA binding protein
LEVHTLQEVADKIKIPVVTLRKYLKDGKLKGIKIGKHWRITDEQLAEFLKQQTR